MPADLFRVALTRDFLDRAGRVGFGDIGLAALDAADGLAYEFLEDDHSELPAGSLAGFGAAIVLAPSRSETSATPLPARKTPLARVRAKPATRTTPPA